MDATPAHLPLSLERCEENVPVNGFIMNRKDTKSQEALFGPPSPFMTFSEITLFLPKIQVFLFSFALSSVLRGTEVWAQNL